MFYRTAVAAACLAAVSCSRPTSSTVLQRVAVLRFENLSANPSLDWMGRAFSEVVAGELAGAPALYVIPPGRLHNLDVAFGSRPAGAPGISAEHAVALGAGASRIGYGEYWLQSGRLQARLTLEEVSPGKITKQIQVSAAEDDVLGAATLLAKQLDNGAAAYGTRSAAAMKAYVLGLESSEAAGAAQRFEEAIAADPAFGPPYSLLAQWKIQQRDRGGAAALLGQALNQGDRMLDLERAKIEFEAAGLRGDAAARRQALAVWSRLAPNDPAVWRSIADLSLARREYKQSIEAYQKALAVEPDDGALLNQLGYAAAFAGDLSTAVRALQHYQALRPGDANPLDSLGDVNLLLGRLREAEDFYLLAVKKDPAFQGGGDFFKAAMARLMTGDMDAADALAKQYVDRRAETRDPLVEYYRAEWSWISGRRKKAADELAAFARGAETGPLRQVAAEAYGELAVWNVVLGNRSQATQLTLKAATLAGPASAATVAVARFLAQAPVSAAEWSVRANQAYPEPSQKPVRDLALSYALLADKQFPAAVEVLKTIYDSSSPGSDESVPLLLAWAYLEAGKAQEAAGLLRFNPIPPSSLVRPFRTFYFPRLFYLRGRIAALAGSADQARAQFRVFLQLSGDQPLAWGEEAHAREGRVAEH